MTDPFEIFKNFMKCVTRNSAFRATVQLLYFSVLAIVFLLVAAFVNPWPKLPNVTDDELLGFRSFDKETAENIWECKGDYRKRESPSPLKAFMEYSKSTNFGWKMPKLGKEPTSVTPT